MATEKTLAALNGSHIDFNYIKALIYDKCGFDVINLTLDKERSAYGACSYTLNGKKIQQRNARITPKKSGQFVAIWKRNKHGITTAFEFTDDIDFIIIIVSSGEEFGQFIFPKLALADNGIITRNGKAGKRGIRVYPPWDIPTSKQARQTQTWQTKYFLTISKDGSTNLDFAKTLLINNAEISE